MVIAGSVFLVGEARTHLLGDETDPVKVTDPVATLHAANRFLELGIPAERLDAIAGEHRHEDAKVGGARFSVDSRRQAYRKVEEFYGDELDKGLEWMVRNNPGTQLVPELPGPLG